MITEKEKAAILAVHPTAKWAAINHNGDWSVFDYEPVPGKKWFGPNRGPVPDGNWQSSLLDEDAMDEFYLEEKIHPAWKPSRDPNRSYSYVPTKIKL